jgi:hypothetical protein
LKNQDNWSSNVDGQGVGPPLYASADLSGLINGQKLALVSRNSYSEVSQGTFHGTAAAFKQGQRGANGEYSDALAEYKKVTP